eukprot:TRINITY_DN9486_c0_g1_i3.p4 TRINITY_DN9486_c0_g1~~TRINITY_DN9486_c0_g1_i3.p4  ORF type:complete len:207 (-),score=77.16 TRINITY_DN9486_c0_g1_i3:357-977(-)
MPKKNFRKRKQVSDSDDDDDERRKKMLDAKALQQMRDKKMGLTDKDLLGLKNAGPEDDDDDEAAEDTGLEKTFTDAATAEKQQVNEQMAEWVDKKMGNNGDAAPGEGEEKSLTQMQEELFDVEDEFKDAVAACKDKLAEEGTWLTGIAEYSLPLEFKLKNLEATEAAKRNIIASKQAAARNHARKTGSGAAGAAAGAKPQRKVRTW